MPLRETPGQRAGLREPEPGRPRSRRPRGGGARAARASDQRQGAPRRPAGPPASVAACRGAARSAARRPGRRGRAARRPGGPASARWRPGPRSGLGDLVAQGDEQRGGRPGVQRDLEGLAQLAVELGVGPAQQERHGAHVRRGRDGQQLGRAVEEPEGDGVVERERARSSTHRARAPPGRRAAAPDAAHDEVGDPDDDQGDDRVVDVVQRVLPRLPVVAGLAADDRQQQHPRQAAQRGEGR